MDQHQDPSAGQPGTESDWSRRRFMAVSAGAATAGAAAAAVIAGADEAEAATSGKAVTAAAASGSSRRGLTHTIADAKHIVILMQENRSFDHYYGTLRGVRGFGDRATIQLAGGHSVFEQPNGSARQYPWAFSATSPAGGADPERLAQCNGDLAHSWSDQHAAWNNGRLDSWVAAKGNVRTLGHLQREDIPFHYALADNWTICDAYHCSIISATGPNRTYLWSGMIDPGATAGGPAYNGGDESGLSWQTYAEALQNAGVSWKVYQNADDNFGDNGLAYFKQFQNASPSSPLATQGMGSVPPATGRTPDDIAAGIRADVLAGKLPQVSWVVSDQASSEHPYATPEDGAHFVHLVMDALNADPDVFNSTILFLNYDENDGFFDHVPPPVAPAGTAGEFYDGTNIGLGFRVPMTVISPWSRGGWVNSEVFDHTSVLQFLEVWTKAIGKPATCPNISEWRRSVTGDLTSTLDFGKPVFGMPVLPDTSATIGLAACGPLPNPAPADNALPVQEPGTRPARALPYQPNAGVSRYDFGSGGSAQVWISMDNTGAQATSSAHFSVYANAYRSGGPWQYTVPAGGTVSDFFNCGTGYGNGAYDLTVVGPNRFLRRFRGNATTAGVDLSVSAAYDRASGSDAGLHVTFANGGKAKAVFTVTTNGYGTAAPVHYTVAAGRSSVHSVNVHSTAHGWYDVTITCDLDASWSQRFTGHVESGRDSISG
ncbi:phosphocholine-specific phospholipase C [Streptacidiphilus sp. PB12-B1b]|uniref:phosphocholine-specific phospholipase C n=1 Tax=Streptacidiphilus sp. PB12-B1b TaxID=2705012 RepID=UPI0015FC42A5|nr:phospholipase C, phosphocholine-specific [Streptacidiphilus sp. PB12-B1b]